MEVDGEVICLSEEILRCESNAEVARSQPRTARGGDKYLFVLFFR